MPAGNYVIAPPSKTNENILLPDNLNLSDRYCDVCFDRLTVAGEYLICQNCNTRTLISEKKPAVALEAKHDRKDMLLKGKKKTLISDLPENAVIVETFDVKN